MGNQLSCCQTNVAASLTAGFNNSETHANTVSNQKALARELFDAMLNKRASITKQTTIVGDSGIPVSAGQVHLAERYEKEEGETDKFDVGCEEENLNRLGCCVVSTYVDTTEAQEGEGLFAQARAGRPAFSSIAGISSCWGWQDSPRPPTPDLDESEQKLLRENVMTHLTPGASEQALQNAREFCEMLRQRAERKKAHAVPVLPVESLKLRQCTIPPVIYLKS